jgi:hypothetical protein
MLLSLSLVVVVAQAAARTAPEKKGGRLCPVAMSRASTGELTLARLVRDRESEEGVAGSWNLQWRALGAEAGPLPVPVPSFGGTE